MHELSVVPKDEGADAPPAPKPQAVPSNPSKKVKFEICFAVAVSKSVAPPDYGSP